MALYSAQYGNAFKVTSAGTVLIGVGALNSETTSGAFNTCIGYQAGDSITSGTLNTIIGYNGDVATTTGSATVIGADATSQVASAATISIALGYGASSTKNSVCTIGNPSDRVRVVEYGSHFGLHYNETVWEGEGGYTGSTINVSGLQVFDGMVTLYQTGYYGSSSHSCVITSASNVVGAIPDCQVGTAFYLKVGVYNSDNDTVKLTVTFGTGWTLLGNSVIPSGSYRNGCINFLCIVTDVSTPAITVISTGG